MDQKAYAFATNTVTDDDQRHRSSQKTDNVPTAETVIWERKVSCSPPNALTSLHTKPCHDKYDLLDSKGEG